MIPIPSIEPFPKERMSTLEWSLMSVGIAGYLGIVFAIISGIYQVPVKIEVRPVPPIVDPKNELAKF